MCASARRASVEPNLRFATLNLSLSRRREREPLARLTRFPTDLVVARSVSVIQNNPNWRQPSSTPLVASQRAM
jgi:hypothetical protein